MNILLADDDNAGRKTLGNFLRQLGHRVVECQDGEEAWDRFMNENFKLVLSDIRMPGKTGIELLKNISLLSGSCKTYVVLITGYGDIEDSVAALRAGAFDFLLKPINVEQLVDIIKKIEVMSNCYPVSEELSSEKKERVTGADKLRADDLNLAGIGIFSPVMHQVNSQALKYYGDRSIPVLIEGETGTGKEVVAGVIHQGKVKSDRPLADINCAAISPGLFESELFGYEAGAFTGGLVKGQKGKVDLAEGGTLLLDEIGELPLELQSKLLRFIQEKSYYRVGGLTKIAVDVRIIGVTNVDLAQKVAMGKFRQDLYYRLKVGYIKVPPLRQRITDILPLATMFLETFARRKKKKFSRISSAAAKMLQEYQWPGNIRELKNLIEWVVFMYDEEIVKPEHLGYLSEKTEVAVNRNKQERAILSIEEFELPDGRLPLEELNNKIVKMALEKYQGNKTEAAKYLDISRSSLYVKIKNLE